MEQVAGDGLQEVGDPASVKALEEKTALDVGVPQMAQQGAGLLQTSNHPVKASSANSKPRR